MMMEMNNSEETPEMSPMAEIKGQIQSYIDDPKLVTPETLKDLLMKVEDMEKFMDSDGEPEPEPEEAGNSIGGMIKKQKMGGGY